MAQQISGESEMVVPMDISSDCNSPDNNSLINCSPSQKSRASVVAIDDTSSDSNPPPPSLSGPSHIESDRKRKLVVSTNVLTKKPNKAPDSVEDLSSTLTEKDVKRRFEEANISVTDYDFLVPSEDQRANRPPEGYISVYAKQITLGLRFPMHDMVVRICNLMQVCPSQLVPNAHGMIVGFIVCATFYGMPLTEGCFFSLFNIIPSPAKGFFQFSPIKGRSFLYGRPSSYGFWKKKFFFLRRKGNPWNCITEWRESFTKPTLDASLAEDSFEKGLGNHLFHFTKLTSKDILVCGGIEPGVQPQLTFRYLMRAAAIPRFDLLPEDYPGPHATMGSGTSSAANNYSRTLTLYTASPAHPSLEQPLNNQQSLSTPRHTEIPSQTAKLPVRENLQVLYEDNIPPMETNSLVPVSDEASRQSVPTGSRTQWQTIESTDVPIAQYLKLESKSQELSSELTYSKSRIEELKQELELSEARRVDSENQSYLANEAIKNLSKRDRILDSELAYSKLRIEELQQELELSESRSLFYENTSYLANEALENMIKRDRSRDSELTRAKSRIQELESAEAERTNNEQKYFLFFK